MRFRLRIWIPSRKSAINEAVASVRRLATCCHCPEEQQTDLEIALREALANAILHGNGNHSRRKIFLRCYGGPGTGILIAVRDQGSGFDPASVPDPRRADRVHLETGRGLLLMRELMDRLEYRRGGREVVLFREISP